MCCVLFYMLLGAALQELKIMESKLSRLYRLRSETFDVPENKPVEVEFDQITGEINILILQIRDLKTAIHKTNANTIVEANNESMSMQKLIILIGDLRSELNQLEMLKPKGAVYLGGQAVEYKPQRKQDEVAAMISEVEQHKADLDKILQVKNWETELLE